MRWPRHHSRCFARTAARYAGDGDFERLIGTLKRVSPEFRTLWPRQDVLRALGSHKRIKHPIAGRMTFEYTSFAVMGQADMKLVVYTPLDADRTAEKLDALLAMPVNRRPMTRGCAERARAR
jgi:hypothetical protein